MTQPTPAPVPGQPPVLLPASQPIPTPAPPVPAPVPQPTAPQPASATGAQNTPPAGARQAQLDMGDGDLPYFQEGVPWRQLPPEQQTAYWIHRARKHEDRVSAMRDYDQLKADQARYQELLTTTQTERERDIEAARRQGESTAMGRANTMLVEAYVRSAAAARGVDEDAVSDFLDMAKLDAFIVNGQVDTAKVYRQVNRMTPGAGSGALVAGVPAPPAAVVPQAPAVPAPPAGWPQYGQPQQYGQPPAQQVPGQSVGAPVWYGQQHPGVPAPPAWPGHQPAAPSAPGGPDFGQGQYTQAPPSGLEAGKAAARARYGERSNSTTNPQAA